MSTQPYDELYATISQKFRDRHIPMSVELEITKRCHMDCIHCYVDHADTRGELSFGEIETLLDDLAALGVLQLSITGGEPFVRRDAWEILSAARARGFYLRLFTTATMLDDAAIARLHELAVAEVHVSLYSTEPAEHEAITRRPGSFEKSLAAMRAIAAAGIAVWLKSVVIRQNLNRILDLVALAEAEGFRYQFDTNVTPAENDARLPLDYRLSQADLNAFLSDPAVARALFKSDGLKTMCAALVNADTTGGLCDIGGATGRVDALGRVQPCALYPPVDAIRVRPFSEIWQQNETIAALRAQTYADQHSCASCPHVQTCSPCPAFAAIEGGDPRGCSSGSRMHAIAFEKLVARVEDAGDE